MGRRPVDSPYVISTEFGVPDTYAKFGLHSGVDYAVEEETPVKAPIAGEVIYAQYHQIRGNMVCIFDGENTHRLMHNNHFKTQIGHTVREGQVIALSGNTGTSTGPHSHWDIIKGRKVEADSFDDFIDPWEWLLEHTEVTQVEAPSVEVERLLDFQRRVSSEGVNHRDAPSRMAGIRREWEANEVLDMKGYVVGEDVDGNDRWFVGKYTGGFMWSGSFTDPSVGNLPDLTNELLFQPDPAKPIEVPVVDPYEYFDADLECVTDIVPVHRTNYEKGNFPLLPSGVVIHDYGTDGRDTTQSAHNHFRAENTTAPHFSVDADGIYQHGLLTWRMYHAGPQGNDKIGIEVDPNVDTNAATAANLDKLLRELDNTYDKLRRFKHSEFMNTSCGDDILVSRFWLESMYPDPDPDEPTPTVPIEPEKPADDGNNNPKEDTVKDYNQVVVNIVVTFVEGFLAAWLVTNHSVEKTALVGAAAAGASAVWNIVLKPFLASRKAAK